MIVIEQPGTMHTPDNPRLLRGTLPYYRGRDHPQGELTLSVVMWLEDERPIIALSESQTGINAHFECYITHDFFDDWNYKFLSRLVPWSPNSLQSIYARYVPELMSPHPVYELQQIQVWPDPYTQEINITSMSTGGRIVLSQAHQAAWASDLLRVIQIGGTIEQFIEKQRQERRADLLLHVYNLIHESIL